MFIPSEILVKLHSKIWVIKPNFSFSLKRIIAEKFQKRFFVAGSLIKIAHRNFFPYVINNNCGWTLDGAETCDQLAHVLFAVGLYLD